MRAFIGIAARVVLGAPTPRTCGGDRRHGDAVRRSISVAVEDASVLMDADLRAHAQTDSAGREGAARKRWRPGDSPGTRGCRRKASPDQGNRGVRQSELNHYGVCGSSSAVGDPSLGTPTR